MFNYNLLNNIIWKLGRIFFKFNVIIADAEEVILNGYLRNRM